MQKTGARLLIATLAAVGLMAGQAKAQAVAEKWVPLGCQKVEFNVDRVVLRVGNREGRFRALRLRAEGNKINMLDLKVVYGSGAPDDIPVRAEIRAGGTSGRLDLRGLDRAIDRVEMIYRTQPNFRGRGSVCVDGLAVVAVAPKPPVVVVPPAGGTQWVRLGCQRVGFRVDRDVVRVGPQPGGFRAIRLRVAGNEIFMFDVKVVYGSGAADDLPVKALIRAGGASGPLDLKGDRRQINRVELIYRSRPDFRGQAEVCVDGAV
jgi:hypothetical protein